MQKISGQRFVPADGKDPGVVKVLDPGGGNGVVLFGAKSESV